MTKVWYNFPKHNVAYLALVLTTRVTFEKYK